MCSPSDDLQINNGYEGVTGSGDSEVVYVAFQREWRTKVLLTTGNSPP